MGNENKGNKKDDLLAKIQKLENEVLFLKQKNINLIAEKKELEAKYKESKQAISSSSDRISSSSRRFKMATVLYSSIKGFSKLSNTENAKDIIDKLDQFFFQYDLIVKENNIKKIKSIGDTYMCAGGIPKKNHTNPLEVIIAAIQILQYLKSLQAVAENNNVRIWNLSIGIHTGPVVANISGKRRISYDLKGETVNIAQRIESSVKAGKVIISGMTLEFVREFFDCEYIGTMPAKYTGDVTLYEVVGFKDKFCLNGNKYVPNKLFNIRFNFLRFDDLEEYILNRLEKELPKYLYYHNVKHTMDVVIGVEIIGISEGVSEEELLLLKTAALFHDMGQIVQSPGHEEIGCDYAKKILPQYKYQAEDIAIICELIMATKIPPQPKNLLEKIICDADLDYLGRSDFIPVSDTLYRELHEQNIISDINEWNKLQIKFISNHQYFTKFAQENREVNKQKQIERIKSLLK